MLSVIAFGVARRTCELGGQTSSSRSAIALRTRRLTDATLELALSSQLLESDVRT